MRAHKDTAANETTAGVRQQTMAAKLKAPADGELRAVLGGAGGVWDAMVGAVEEKFSPLERLWRPSKSEFGRICLLQHKKRTLLYLTPDREKIWVAIVLGERAAGIAAASALPSAIKKLIREARPYAEGRGIRFAVSSAGDIPMVAELVAIKIAPR